MALNCSTKPEKEYARRALCETLLQYGDISETQRDDLIKKHLVYTFCSLSDDYSWSYVNVFGIDKFLCPFFFEFQVSIVGFLFFLTSSLPNPEMPYFAKETIARSVKTIVDGFMEMYKLS